MGILLVVVAGIYALHPANAIPQFFPGYDQKLMRHHYTHAVAAGGLGILCFAIAYLQSGKKKTHQMKEQ